MGSTVDTRIHLSHSQVGEFLGCPRRYRLHRRLRLSPRSRLSWLQFGIAARETVALHSQRRLDPLRGDEPDNGRVGYGAAVSHSAAAM